MTISSASKPGLAGKRYAVRYRASQYTFPQEDTIDTVEFDAQHIHVYMADGRSISVPLAWIPPINDASPAEREKYILSDDRQLIIWDPEISEINEILRISDYFQAKPHPNRL